MRESKNKTKTALNQIQSNADALGEDFYHFAILLRMLDLMLTTTDYVLRIGLLRRLSSLCRS